MAPLFRNTLKFYNIDLLRGLCVLVHTPAAAAAVQLQFFGRYCYPVLILSSSGFMSCDDGGIGSCQKENYSFPHSGPIQQNEQEEVNAESIACNMDTVYWKAGCLQNKAYHVILSSQRVLEFPITTKPKLLNVIVNRNDAERNLSIVFPTLPK